MLWSTDSIQRLLNLYLEHRLLWDTRHKAFNDKNARENALQAIAEQLGIPNVTAEDISRKYRSMRAAYRVELRNIKTAKLRGFFYKPTLHWFAIFKQFMADIEEQKMREFDVPEKLILQGGLTDGNQYVFTIKGDNNATYGKLNKNLPPVVHLVKTDSNTRTDLEMEEDYLDEEFSSDESEDEFQSFADHIAEQLRSMSVHRAVMIQNQIQKIFANDREIHGEYNEEEEDEMAQC